jgi:hypothetical protein
MNADPPSSRIPTLDQRAVVPAHVVQRQFAEETVVLNLNTGQYHGLNATGGAMFEALAAAPTVRAAVAKLAERYGRLEHEIEPDVIEFVDQIVERDLVTLELPP